MTQSLRQLAQHLAETWKQLGLNQRVSLVLGAGVVLAGLIGLSVWSSRPDYSLLYGKLDDAEAAKVMAALDDAKVPYKTGRGGSSILVPSDKVYSMRAQMAAKGIPRGEGVGFEIFDKSNFGISDFVQRANYLRAVQGELARTIGQIDQIENARVMIVMPENRLLVDNQKKPTASVFVRVRGNGQLAASAVNSIRFLVANAVEGLSVNSVSIVDNLGNVLSENEQPDSVAGLSNNQLAARRNLEQYLSRKAEGMLEKVLGPGQAVVRVAAEINWDTTTRTEEKYDPDGSVLRSGTINDETTTSTSAESNGGAVGVPSNATGGDTNNAAAPMNNSQTKKKVSNNVFDVSRSSSQILQAAGGIRRLSAAIFVSQKVEGTGKDRKAVPRSDEEIQKLKRLVQSSLGIVEGDALRKDEITLEQLPFNDQPALDLTEKLESDGKRAFYWDIARNGSFALLAVVFLVVFLKLLKKTSGDIPVGAPPVPLDESGNPIVVGAAPKPSMVTVDALNALIRENPASVGQAVRSWLTTSNGNVKSN